MTPTEHDPDETPEEYEAAVQIRCMNAVRADREKIADRLQHGVRQDLHASQWLIELGERLLAKPTLDEQEIRQHLASLHTLVRTATHRVVELEDELRNPDLEALRFWQEANRLVNQILEHPPGANEAPAIPDSAPGGP